MGEKIELPLEDRTVTGKKVAVVRSQGMVPGVLYGQDMTPQAVMAPRFLMTKVYLQAGKHHPIEVQVGGARRLAMIQSADIDPVKRQLRHLAFHVIRQNEKVETAVPVVIEGEGETPAEKAGLVVLKTIESVEISALPSDLPDSLSVPGDILAAPSDHVTVADITAPQVVTILTDPSQVIATVYEPSALVAANEAAGGKAEEAMPTEEGEEPGNEDEGSGKTESEE